MMPVSTTCVDRLGTTQQLTVLKDGLMPTRNVGEEAFQSGDVTNMTS